MCSTLPSIPKVTDAGSPGGSVVTESTTTDVMPETLSMRSLRLLNWPRTWTASARVLAVGKLGS